MGAAAGIYIGTSGWSYPKGEGTWKGHFYPPGKLDELACYSRFFNTVEVNSSFYRPPNPGYAASWVKRTPPGFRFAVKLWQKFTHPEMYRRATGEAAAIELRDVELFLESLRPLQQAGKLGALLAQFPPGFRNDDYGRQHLKAVMRHFGDCNLAVELRHRSWSDDADTAALLRENNTCWVRIDEPQFASSIAADLPLTSGTAYFRFHGRNAADWWQGDSESRYRYLYSPEEIAELSRKVKAAGAKLTFAFFNNHWQGYAPRNAVDMKQHLQLPFTDLPAPEERAEDDRPRLL
jgi:uncharacterized protein YecE (DUF72 family)